MTNPSTPSIDQLKRAMAIAEDIQALEAEMAALFGQSPVSKSAVQSSAAPKKSGGKSKISAAGRARIAAAQRARWAKAKAGKPAAKPVAKKGGLTAAGRARLAASMKARWAARKHGAPAPTAKKAKTTAAAKPVPAKPAKKTRKLTPEGRAKLAAMMKARWAARKQGASASKA